MRDLVQEMADFIRRQKLPAEWTDEVAARWLAREIDRRWPEATQRELDLAARKAVATLKEDSATLQGWTALWEECGPHRRGTA